MNKSRIPEGKARARTAVRPSGSVRRRILLALGWYDYEVNRGVAAYAREAHWILNDMAGHTREIPLHWRCDGVLVSLPKKLETDLAYLLRKRVPVVDLRAENGTKLPRVVLDNEAIGRMAAEHLLSRGFSDFAYYQAYAGRVEEDRMTGFRRAVEKAGKKFHHLDMTSAPRVCRRGERRLAHLAELIAALPKPVGVMGQYDVSASEVAMACERASIPVPEHVAVVGADNDPITSELGVIPLTSVDTDRFRHGYEAAALLDRLLNGEKAPAQPVRIPPKGVVLRKSTGVIAIKNLHVSRALTFIWEHFMEPIQIKDVVQASEISRRLLFTLFRQHLNCTIMDEITRLRILRAKALLKETDDKTFAIALACGFSDARHLNKTFQRETGMTPTDYRQSK
ncbi:MAG TPA: DNA-binding transcriptional regulator [Kiritimatiellia bacterium]|nr:DNA-binding transcriptional regulator [Kiritimatiellia bacterium]HMP32771.1 DNA-binding transcriptional regulator [Kiritimatiellia bacterium]